MSSTRNFLRSLTRTALLLLAACQSARHPSWSPAQPEDASAALSTWRARANAGDADAQYTIGLLYERGALVEEDTTQAAHWYELAAAQQHPLALERLASDAPLLPARAKQVSPVTAAASLELGAPGASKDEPRAYRDQLASLRLTGHGISRDPEVAFGSWPTTGD